jgi:hypothetical protein
LRILRLLDRGRRTGGPDGDLHRRADVYRRASMRSLRSRRGCSRPAEVNRGGCSGFLSACRHGLATGYPRLAPRAEAHQGSRSASPNRADLVATRNLRVIDLPQRGLVLVNRSGEPPFGRWINMAAAVDDRTTARPDAAEVRRSFRPGRMRARRLCHDNYCG